MELEKVKLLEKRINKIQRCESYEEPSVVYIPIIIGMSTDFEIHVNDGEHVNIGTKIATRKDIYVPLYSPISGTVKGIIKKMHTSGRLQNHLVIEK